MFNYGDVFIEFILIEFFVPVYSHWIRSMDIILQFC